VLAPSTAGVTLGGALARQLGVGLQLAALDAQGRAERVLGEAELTNQRVLLVNDVITTGDGLIALRDVVTQAGGSVIGAACFGIRSEIDVAERLGVPATVSVALRLPAVPADRCPLCRDGVAHIEDALDIN
jgi:orotate phosphoribosyltransferase